MYVSVGCAIGFVLGFAAFALLFYPRSSSPEIADAVKRGNVPEFESLLPASINSVYYIDEREGCRYSMQTLLQMVIKEGKDRHRSEMIRILLSKGADPNRIDSMGNTPLMRAVELGDENGSHAVVQQLLTAGARVNERSGPWLETPLYRASRIADAELVNMLIANGADVLARDRHGRTPLHAAASSPRHVSEIEATIRVLLRDGADPMILDRNGKRPIDLLRDSRYTKEIHDLLDPEQKNEMK
jgi:ankyrin repeat protein